MSPSGALDSPRPRRREAGKVGEAGESNAEVGRWRADAERTILVAGHRLLVSAKARVSADRAARAWRAVVSRKHADQHREAGIADGAGGGALT